MTNTNNTAAAIAAEIIGADRVEMSARNCAFVDWIETSADCYC